MSSVQHTVSTLYFLRNANIRTKVSGITSSVTYVCTYIHTYRTSFFLISRRIARYLTKQNNNLVDVFTKGRTIYLPVSLTTYIASTTYTHTHTYIHIRTYGHTYIYLHMENNKQQRLRERETTVHREKSRTLRRASRRPNRTSGAELL